MLFGLVGSTATIGSPAPRFALPSNRYSSDFDVCARPGATSARAIAIPSHTPIRWTAIVPPDAASLRNRPPRAAGVTVAIRLRRFRLAVATYTRSRRRNRNLYYLQNKHT